MARINVILLTLCFSFYSYGNSHFSILSSWEEAKVDEELSANYLSLRGRQMAACRAVLTCSSVSHSVSSTGHFLLAPALGSAHSPECMWARVGMFCSSMCQKDIVRLQTRPQAVLAWCQCLLPSEEFRGAGAASGGWGKVMRGGVLALVPCCLLHSFTLLVSAGGNACFCPLFSLYPSRACVGIAAKRIFLS